jgi:hypothetical protein
VTRIPSPSVLLTKNSTRTEIKKSIALSMAFGAVAIGTGLAACSSVHQPAPISSNAPGSSISAASLQVHIPDPLKVPSGNTLAGSFEGYGQQIYQCTNNSWTLLQPAAIISDHGKPIAVHSKGPVWISTVDGSEVSATQVPNAVVNHDDAIPELLLKANENRGGGEFGSVTYVQRLATKGGLAPKGRCTDGDRQSAQYSASYLFYTAG